MGRLTKLTISAATVAVVGVAIAVAKDAASSYIRGEFLPIDKAEKKWGKTPFDAEKFKKGNETTRAAMAVSLIASKQFVGKPLSTVKDALGEADGYYVNDGIPAYIISPVEKQPKGSDVWQIIFLPDEKWEKVSEVKIHKNCCYK